MISKIPGGLYVIASWALHASVSPLRPETKQNNTVLEVLEALEAPEVLA